MRRMLPLRYVRSILFVCFNLSYFFIFIFFNKFWFSGFYVFFSQCGVVLQDVAVHPSASSVLVTARALTACCFSIISVSDLALCAEIVMVCLPKTFGEVLSQKSLKGQAFRQ